MSTIPLGLDDVTEYQALLRAVRQGVIPVFAAGTLSGAHDVTLSLRRDFGCPPPRPASGPSPAT